MADHVEGNLPNAGGLRLQGKLRLCAALIRVLKRYSVGAHSGGGLIEKLLIGGCNKPYAFELQLTCVFQGCWLVLLHPASSGCAGAPCHDREQSWCPPGPADAGSSRQACGNMDAHAQCDTLHRPAHAEYLFPAANLMAKQKEDPDFSLSTVPHAELYVALNARCSTKASRQVCAPVILSLSACIAGL